jgi:hypothetical protein
MKKAIQFAVFAIIALLASEQAFAGAVCGLALSTGNALVSGCCAGNAVVAASTPQAARSHQAPACPMNAGQPVKDRSGCEQDPRCLRTMQSSALLNSIHLCKTDCTTATRLDTGSPLQRETISGNLLPTSLAADTPRYILLHTLRI